VSQETFGPTVVGTFGGLCTYIDRVALRPGLSPDCKNVRFAPGLVATRDAYVPILTDSAQPFYGVSQLVTANGDKHLVTVADNGRIKAEFPAGTQTLLEEKVATFPTLKCADLFSVKYMAFSDGKTGIAPMRRYDGRSVRPVGMGAPGSPVTLADSGTGATGTGLLAGLHYGVIVFVNKDGDWSGISPIASFTSVGGRKTVIGLPYGPTGTTQRIVGLSPVGDPGHFLYTDKLIVGDNVTTSITVDIDEDELLYSQTSLNRYASAFVPWLPIGCAAYQERLITWGARAAMLPVAVVDVEASPPVLRHDGLWNLAFDGGFNGTTPNGWTSVIAGHSAGGAGTALAGRVLRITGDNASAAWGEVSQAATNSTQYIRRGGRYGLSVIARSTATATGTLRILIQGTAPVSATILSVSIPLPIGENDQTWTHLTFEQAADTAHQFTNLSIRVWMSGGPLASSEWVELAMALYDADDAQAQHTMFISETGQPGTFIGEDGVVSVGPDDGEGIRNVFALRDALFVAKERSLHMVGNSSGTSPASWSASLYDSFGGTPSVHGVAPGNGYVLIAGRDGLRYFDGGAPRIVSRVIKPEWVAADWSKGERAIVIVDPPTEIVRVALPSVNGGGRNDLLYVGDFKSGWSDDDGEGGVHWSLDTFGPYRTTRILAGALILNETGIHTSVLSVIGREVWNEMSDSSDFSTDVFVYPDETPTITTGQADGRSGNYASLLTFTGGGRTMTTPLPSASVPRGIPSVSFRIKPAAQMTVSVALENSGPTHVAVCPAGVWTRVVASFYEGTIATGADVVITLGSGTASTATLADFQIAYYNEREDWGFADTRAGAIFGNQCALLVSPSPLSRRDFSGRIYTTYETGMLGAQLGRSTFGRCFVRAAGSGMLAAEYKGVGARAWAMTSLALSSSPEEDLEYGADLKSSLASVKLSNSSEDGWFVVRSLAAMIAPLGVSWARGRN
jgi:hypothetical protein